MTLIFRAFSVWTFRHSRCRRPPVVLPPAGGRLLGSIFWEVAAVPQAPLTLKNTAAVVRYLLWLARRGVPKSLVKSDRKAIDQYRREVDIEAGRPCIKHRRIREQTTRLAMGIWGDLLQQAVITPATADQTRRFLNECQLHLMGYPELEAAHKMIEEFAVPADSDDPFKPPTLLSLHSRRTGGKPYRDDLLERIYAAHHALVTSGIRPAGRLVADALNNRKARHRLSDSEPRTWDDSHVKDRIKSLDRGIRKHFRDTFGSILSEEVLDARVRSRRAQIVNKWLFLFRPLPIQRC